VPSNLRQSDTALSLGLAFVGGYGDAASFVLAKTFTGHVTGNLVLGAIGVALHDWRATLGSLSAIVAFFAGVVLSTLVAHYLKAWPSLPLLSMVMAVEVILIVAASFALALDVAHGIGIFVVFVSLALGLQNGAFRRAGGVSVHTTYLTGMLTSLILTEAEKYTSGSPSTPPGTSDPKIGVLFRVWVAFVLGAGTGAAMVLHFRAFGMLGAALALIMLLFLPPMAGAEIE
jgi:uncharacterized membrane protein YoaK (UPF0700 family)